MSVTMQIPEQVHSSLQTNVPEGARILIVCDNESDRRRVKILLREAGFDSDCANSITAGCEAARSGQYQVIVSTPQLSDGTWRRLADVGNHFDLHYEVVLWAHNFDLHEWSEALNYGAFDVVDAVFDRPRVAEVTKCALWAAYLRGARPNPKPIRPAQKEVA
jgi:DNA-binding NtrC family response regulator